MAGKFFPQHGKTLEDGSLDGATTYLLLCKELHDKLDPDDSNMMAVSDYFKQQNMEVASFVASKREEVLGSIQPGSPLEKYKLEKGQVLPADSAVMAAFAKETGQAKEVEKAKEMCCATGFETQAHMLSICAATDKLIFACCKVQLVRVMVENLDNQTA